MDDKGTVTTPAPDAAPEKEKKKRKWLLFLILFLILIVIVTAIVWVTRLMNYLPDDSDAIDLLKNPSVPAGSTAGSSDGSGDSSSTDSGSGVTNTFTANPAFEVEDGKQKWSTRTDVEIFRISYENGEEVVTVQSEDGEKVIAPGTEHSYTFKLKNVGNVAIKYTVSVDVVMSPSDAAIPVEARLRRFDGRWVLGGKEEYEDSDALNDAVDHFTLGANKYSYYTLDWRWLFESGDDAHDTYLGNLAADQPVSYTIVIRTYATENEDPNADGGIIIPANTSDNVDLIVWSMPAVCSLLLLIVLPVVFRKRKADEDAEDRA